MWLFLNEMIVDGEIGYLEALRATKELVDDLLHTGLPKNDIKVKI